MNILITGGSSGIGEAMARRLADGNNQIIITGRSEKKLENICNSLSNVRSIAGDVSSTGDVNRICEYALSELGEIDLLILNAGVGRFKPIEEMTDEDFDSQFNTNVRGVFLFLRNLIPHFRERNTGQIIITSSNLGFNSYARTSIYSATKYAVQAMVTSIREELAGTGVKIGTINPGSVDTPWFADYDCNKPNPKRLDVNDVVDAFMLLINQGERSNIDHILILPGN